MGILRDFMSTLTLGIIDDTKTVERKEGNKPKTYQEIKNQYIEEYNKAHEAEMEERNRRRSIPLAFKSPITKSRFNELAIEAGKKIKRLSIETKGHDVIGTVKSTSGLSEWNFELDFNDYGKITGRYWETYIGNYDSKIPEVYGKELSNLLIKELTKHICPKCGANLLMQKGFELDNKHYVCKSCGYHIFGEKVYSGEKYPGVYWFCDNCNEWLSLQPGFRDVFGKWKCTKCGYVNDISLNENDK